MRAWKEVLAVIVATASIYFQKLLPLILLLGIVMLTDYITGVVSAGKRGEVDSRVGVWGIVKKLFYLCLVGVGICVDLLATELLRVANVDFKCTVITVLIVCWLTINELISIVENLGDIGVPVPAFLKRILRRMKKSVEEAGEMEDKK